MSYGSAQYDYEAFSYDKVRFSSRLGRHLDYMHKRIIKNLHPSGNMVLDAGAGTGRFTIWLAEKGFEVVGVDISREMLKEAKGKADTSRKDIGLVLADLGFLPFRKGVYGGCICINVVNHISDITRFLKEVRYVIKPESFFIFNFPNLGSLYLPVAIIVNLKRLALFKGTRIRSKWFTVGEIDTLLSGTGFNIEELRGCMIASPIPLGESLVKIVQIINFLCESSKLKLFSGSLFVKALPFTKLGPDVSR